MNGACTSEATFIGSDLMCACVFFFSAGTAYDPRRIKTVSGYVIQDDLLLAYLTVR